MKTRSILVSFPGHPFDFESLLPHRGLATVAGNLLDAGHDTEIRDYGTVDALDRLSPRSLRSAARLAGDQLLGDWGRGRPLSVLSTLWRLRGIDRALHLRREALCAEVAWGIASERGLDFVWFALDRPEDLVGTIGIARRLREAAPALRLAASGALLTLDTESLVRGTGDFDCLCMDDADATLVEWAERLDRPDTWGEVPNLAPRCGGRYPVSSDRRAGPKPDIWPSPVYSADTYPALADGAKFKLFSLEDSRGLPLLGFRAKSARGVCDEMARLTKLHGARVFHIASQGTPKEHIEAVAHEILSRGLTVWYSRWGAIRGASPAVFSSLQASGCRAAAFQVDTGSQWLLDNHYGHDFGITQVEQALRACKFSGIFTVAHLTYPCAQDDYHTKAETVRLVTRTKPHAARVAIPFAQYTYRAGSGARPSAHAVREYEALAADIAELGVATPLSAAMALVAHATGYEGQEQDFCAMIRRQLLTGDADAIAALTERFNRCACAEPDLAAYRPFAHVLPAVGN